ncbi:MAG: SMP-30/gluconolactonase/LRE family protein [Myxococcota bacterium]
MTLLAIAWACTPPDTTDHTDGLPPDGDADTDTDTDTDVDTSGTGDTAPTDTAPYVDPDCVGLPPAGPFPYVESTQIHTEEDFDFDQAGFLITQANQDLAGVTRNGQQHIVAPSIGVDAAGLRSLSTGDIMVAQPDTGSLRLVNYATGGSIVILGGLSFPNGLEATADGKVFSSEYATNGRIRLLDPYADTADVIAQMDNPNNMALSPDGNTLYIISSQHVFYGNSKIVALDKDSGGDWDPTPRLVHEHGSLLGGIATDKCGNVYTVEYSGGKVFRIRVDDLVVDPIADLPFGSSYSSLRFPPGIGEWNRTELFVTNRYQMYVLDIGLEGHHVLEGMATTSR